MQLFDI